MRIEQTWLVDALSSSEVMEYHCRRYLLPLVLPSPPMPHASCKSHPPPHRLAVLRETMMSILSQEWGRSPGWDVLFKIGGTSSLWFTFPLRIWKFDLPKLDVLTFSPLEDRTNRPTPEPQTPPDASASDATRRLPPVRDRPRH